MIKRKTNTKLEQEEKKIKEWRTRTKEHKG